MKITKSLAAAAAAKKRGEKRNAMEEMDKKLIYTLIVSLVDRNEDVKSEQRWRRIDIYILYIKRALVRWIHCFAVCVFFHYFIRVLRFYKHRKWILFCCKWIYLVWALGCSQNACSIRLRFFFSRLFFYLEWWMEVRRATAKRRNLWSYVRACMPHRKSREILLILFGIIFWGECAFWCRRTL